MILHGYWRSGAAYRVRIALNLKGLAYEQVTHDLRRSEHHAGNYAALNPAGLVPALEADGIVIAQSLAIIEWLEERFPDPPLLPADANERAIVRAMALTLAADTHPLHNMRVLADLRTRFGADEDQVQGWICHWIGEGLSALETMVERHGGAFAFGDTPTLADCVLVPQLYSAERFGVEIAPFPRIHAVAKRARGLPAVAAAHPSRQPDADAA